MPWTIFTIRGIFICWHLWTTTSSQYPLEENNNNIENIDLGLVLHGRCDNFQHYACNKLEYDIHNGFVGLYENLEFFLITL